MDRPIFARPLLPALALALLLPAAAAAGVSLRFTPADTTVQLGAVGRLSILLEGAVAVRTLDVTVTYDTTVVRSLGGGAGALYTDSGIFTFQGFEEEVPGIWHGFAVIMATGQWLNGPGELFYWDFAARADGVSPVIAVEAYLSAEDASWYPEVDLSPASVTVGEPASGGGPPPPAGGALRLSPNPFNPATRLLGAVPTAGRVRLEVFDAAGRRLGVLLDEVRPAGEVRLDWDGRDARGRPLPGGVYLFRLVGPGVSRCVRGSLLK